MSVNWFFTCRLEDGIRRTGTRGLLGGADEHLVVTGHSHAEYQNTKDVEHSDSPERLLDGAGNVLPRVGSLAKSHADHLCASESKAGLAHASPETEESASRTLDEVFFEGAGGVPVLETGSLVVRTAAEGDDEAGDDQGRHDEDLGEAKPEFSLAKLADMKEL